MLVSCHEKQANVNSHLSLDDYRGIANPLYKLDARQIAEDIRLLSRNDADSMQADYRTRRHYVQGGALLWIDRKGVDSRADSLVAYLQCVEDMGFTRRKFCLDALETDLHRLRSLDFSDTDNINEVAARLEYNLTKAYLRYAVGQRFGFVNPRATLNKLDIEDSTGTNITYRTLYDTKVDRAGDGYFDKALHMIHVDSITAFLRNAEPRDSIYTMLKPRLKTVAKRSAEWAKIMVNMERCRWRTADRPQNHSKYVLVNVPSYHLRAVDGDSVLSMRIAFGSMQNKTPLIYSELKRMDINPQWIMPRSIIKKSVIPRLGNHSYFRQHRYFVRHRETGQITDWPHVTRHMLESGQYLVIQRGGEGNALGRIIFRFDNNLSIYLHDTSSRDIFSRSERDVSHGCVRVEKPFALAVFLLDDKEPKLIDRIRYAMNADVSPVGIDREDMTPEMLAVADTLDKRRLIGQVTLKPRVPVFLCYYTLYPDHRGNIESFTDVYGYDAVVYKHLRNYL